MSRQKLTSALRSTARGALPGWRHQRVAGFPPLSEQHLKTAASPNDATPHDGQQAVHRAAGWRVLAVGFGPSRRQQGAPDRPVPGYARRTKFL